MAILRERVSHLPYQDLESSKTIFLEVLSELATSENRATRDELRDSEGVRDEFRESEG